jgi:GNAT superfamily N-acetyltransferase
MFSTTTPSHLRNLARLVPDKARWIDLRGLLLTERCDVWCGSSPGHGFIVASWDFPFAVLYGHPDVRLVSSSVTEMLDKRRRQRLPDEWQLLAAPGAHRLVSLALPGWRHTGIALHRWNGSLEPPELFENLEIMLLSRGLRSARLSLAKLPESSRRELSLEWVARRPAAVAVAGTSVVSICWAAFTTETLWDVAIETIEPFRRRGLAAACFLELAAYMKEDALSPAWAATEDNRASLHLAARLGFVLDGRLEGWSQPR